MLLELHVPLPAECLYTLLLSTGLALADHTATGNTASAPAPKAAAGSLLKDVGAVLSSSIWLCMGAAYALYEGALGTYAYFGPKAVVQLFGVAPETADVLFGGLTVLSGIVGCLAGGLVLDWMGE